MAAMSTCSSFASCSSPAARSSGSADAAEIATIVASNTRPPDIGASRTSVVIRSMPKPRRLSVVDTSRADHLDVTPMLGVVADGLLAR